jgi:alkylation response protein AidB-like acyl-CoA dehydrogenase
MEPAERDRLLQDVDAFCRALRPIEEQCYLARRDTRVARLYEGTDEILTLKIAAAVLGKEYEAFQ